MQVLHLKFQKFTGDNDNIRLRVPTAARLRRL